MNESKDVKIVVTVPTTHTDAVRQAIGEAGGGKIGNYSFCSFAVTGMGKFKPEAGAQPAIGSVGKLEEVTEDRIEVTCNKDLANVVVEAIKKVHPYEEVVIDIYPLLTV